MAAEIEDLAAARARLEGSEMPWAARGEALRGLWERERAAGLHAGYASEAGQDFYLDTRVFGGRRSGVFLDIGGHDGVRGSNTLYFERVLGWTGLLVEPVPARLAEARAARGCLCLGCAVGPRDGRAEFLVVEAGYTAMSGLLESYDPAMLAAVRAHPAHRERIVEVETRTVAGLLREAGLRAVDFVSLDIEGGEVAALEGFPFAEVPVGAWAVENNRGDGAVARILAAAGYMAVEHLGRDEIFVPAEGR